MAQYHSEWSPDVCGCVIAQGSNPSLEYAFKVKCILHEKMDDVDARADIMSLCADKTNALILVKRDEIEAQILGLQEKLVEAE